MATRNKYTRRVPSNDIDVYDVLEAFDVVNPALQHAIKKLLMPGARGKGGYTQDLNEAIQSVNRALEMRNEWHSTTGAKSPFKLGDAVPPTPVTPPAVPPAPPAMPRVAVKDRLAVVNEPVTRSDLKKVFGERVPLYIVTQVFYTTSANHMTVRKSINDWLDKYEGDL